MKGKKKIYNVLIALLLVCVLTITLVPSINAAPKAPTVSAEGVMVSYIGENNKWAKFNTSDGKVAYCMDLDLKWPKDTTNTTLAGEGDAGLSYILQNGYPYKKIKNNGEQDRFITQAAVWWYLSDTGQTNSKIGTALTSGDNDLYGLRPYIQKLVNEAKNAKASAKTSLDVNVSNTNMTLSSDGKYFVSKEITPTLTGASTYKVSVSGAPSGTIIANANGEAKDTFNAGEKFTIKVPSTALGQTTTMKVTVSASSNATKAYIYQPNDKSFQRLAVLYPDETTVSKTVSLTAKLDKQRVCVDYVIVGDVKPDPALTDPTPGKNCFDKGTSYNQEKGLTTRQNNCKFNGWYTKENLTGKWVDGTALNSDMTLYGAWDCGTVINVPNTASKISLTILGVGLLIIAGGVAIYLYRDKKLSSKK